MNNFVFGHDPLLYSSLIPKQSPYTDTELKQQLDNAMTQYQQLQNIQTPQVKDHLGELDTLMKDLSEEVAMILQKNDEFNLVNNELQAMIQEELMAGVRWKINNNQEAVKKIELLKNLISEAKKTKQSEDRQNLAELNDYLKNYSDLTFNEYKKLKQDLNNKNKPQ